MSITKLDDISGYIYALYKVGTSVEFYIQLGFTGTAYCLPQSTLKFSYLRDIFNYLFDIERHPILNQSGILMLRLSRAEHFRCISGRPLWVGSSTVSAGSVGSKVQGLLTARSSRWLSLRIGPSNLQAHRQSSLPLRQSSRGDSLQSKGGVGNAPNDTSPDI
jgi:hypothetical protein